LTARFEDEEEHVGRGDGGVTGQNASEECEGGGKEAAGNSGRKGRGREGSRQKGGVRSR